MNICMKKLACAAAVVLTAAVIAPQAQQDWNNDDWCNRDNWGGDREGYCEVRAFSLGSTGTLSVDAAPNGGIQVKGGPRGDVQGWARVEARAETEARAREIAAGVRIDAAGDRVTAEGPSGLDRRESWSVSYRLSVPSQVSLTLKSSNGGISVSDVDGRLDANTVNGGLKLANVSGEVRGRTSNGGIDVDLDGSTWVGAGLDVQTSNGGVRLRIPEQYSARLEASTENGGLDVDFPITMQGRIRREIATNLGAGGPLIRAKTNNGGIRIQKK